MSQIKAIIFDCDGTLVDSEDAHFAAWRRVLQDIGRDLTGEEYKFFSGKPDITVAGLLTKQIPGVKQEDLSNQKKTYFLEHINEKGLPPIHGTIEFLHRLSKEKLHPLRTDPSEPA
mgnify:CR=1 FL=1